MVMIFQVPKEVYKEFTNYLKMACGSFEKLNDFTPAGEWCLVKAVSLYSENLGAANNYLDRLISRI